MKPLDKHRKILREIADLAFSYGYENSGIDFFEIQNLDEIPLEKRKKFIHSCHKGYKLAQEKLLDEILYYQDLETNKKPNLKDARRARDKELEEKILNDLKIIEHRLYTLSHLADGIAWQLIGGQIHIAKRFFLQEKGKKRLVESNIQHSIEVAEEINKEPDNFALISDLTNFVQIGDLLVVSKGSFGIMELKQGKVNEQIAGFLENLEQEEQEDDKIIIPDSFDKNTAKQVKRVVRQKKRTIQVTNLIKNDEGIDPVTGEKLKINTPVFETEYYHHELEKLHLRFIDRIWSYDVIEGCIHIGMYRDKGLLMAPIALEQIINKDTDNYLMIDWMSIVSNVSEPIFAKPLDPNFIIDVLSGKVKVIFGINFDAVIDLFNKLGLQSEWLPEKETMKFKQNHSNQVLFELNKRAIVMRSQNQEMYFGGGLISKIIYDNIKPSSLAVTMLNIKQ